ncbi:MAG: nitrous oxide-stimulated promoter family protein [Rhodopseudomonas palustris]|nr:nitrous oxide-stimulated promoter family protein [Rhodopseudomonas palustris]
MTLETPRLKREHRTMQCMVEIYCRDHHARGADGPCDELPQRSSTTPSRRLEKCPYGEAKPTCARCPIHCYKRGAARAGEGDHALRRSAHDHAPSLAQPHCTCVDKLRRVEHPMAVRRRERS